MSVNPKLGQIFDASKQTPPNDGELLLFHDEVFAWTLGVYDAKNKKYISRWSEFAVLYWSLVPSRSLLRLKELSSVFKPMKL